MDVAQIINIHYNIFEVINLHKEFRIIENTTVMSPYRNPECQYSLLYIYYTHN